MDSGYVINPIYIPKGVSTNFWHVTLSSNIDSIFNKGILIHMGTLGESVYAIRKDDIPALNAVLEMMNEIHDDKNIQCDLSIIEFMIEDIKISTFTVPNNLEYKFEWVSIPYYIAPHNIVRCFRVSDII